MNLRNFEQIARAFNHRFIPRISNAQKKKFCTPKEGEHAKRGKYHDIVRVPGFWRRLVVSAISGLKTPQGRGWNPIKLVQHWAQYELEVVWKAKECLSLFLWSRLMSSKFSVFAVPWWQIIPGTTLFKRPLIRVGIYFFSGWEYAENRLKVGFCLLALLPRHGLFISRQTYLVQRYERHWSSTNTAGCSTALPST